MRLLSLIIQWIRNTHMEGKKIRIESVIMVNNWEATLAIYGRHDMQVMQIKMKVKSSTNSSVISFTLFSERWSNWTSKLQQSESKCPFLSIPCKIREQNGLLLGEFPISTEECNTLPNSNLIFFPPELALFQYSVATSAEVVPKQF